MGETITNDAQLLTTVEAFCASHGLKPTTFGRLAVGDGSLVANLRAGRSPTLKLANRIVAFMSRYRPEAQAA